MAIHMYPVVLDKMREDNDTTTDEFLFTSSYRYSLHLLVTTVCAVLSSPFHRRASMLDFYFDHSEERPLEAFEDIFASYEKKK